jgi:hypothetical protein
MKNNLLQIAVCIIILFTPNFALSGPASEVRIAELEHTVQNLQQRVEALEARSEQPDEGARATSDKPGNSHDIKNWRQLRQGMSERDVERLLGSPAKVIVSQFTTYWYYNYPRGGEVKFNFGKIVGWQEL